LTFDGHDGVRDSVAQIAFVVDTTKCINCRTCEIACKDANELGPAVRLRRVRTFEGGAFPQVFAYSISMACNHCEEPACVTGCPAGAYTKRLPDGIVVHDPQQCIGCRYCTWLCPYGAPQFDPAAGTVRKCNLCVEELGEGRSPACVSGCPMRAIEIRFIDEGSPAPEAGRRIRGVPSPEITRPSSVFLVREEAIDE
jgi:anaerobic dimethyl sulfoxide reductase subunit B (iron-sulfur subunit)